MPGLETCVAAIDEAMSRQLFQNFVKFDFINLFIFINMLMPSVVFPCLLSLSKAFSVKLATYAIADVASFLADYSIDWVLECSSDAASCITISN